MAGGRFTGMATDVAKSLWSAVTWTGGVIADAAVATEHAAESFGKGAVSLAEDAGREIGKLSGEAYDGAGEAFDGAYHGIGDTLGVAYRGTKEAFDYTTSAVSSAGSGIGEEISALAGDVSLAAGKAADFVDDKAIMLAKAVTSDPATRVAAFSPVKTGLMSGPGSG